MNLQKQIRQDIKQMNEFFPKLLLLNDDGKAPSFEGKIDICDLAGNFWDSFRIRINPSDMYPNGVPQTKELGGRIERIDDRHISRNGTCCLAIHHVLLHHASKGMTITEYTRQYVYTYFANHLYFEQEGHYADKEYKHAFEGVRQFYAETLKLKDPVEAIKVLEGVIFGGIPLRNKKCICGRDKKFKFCHLHSINYLQSLGTEVLDEDLQSFKMLVESNQLTGTQADH